MYQFRLSQSVSFILLLLAGLGLTTLLAQEAGETVIKREPIEHDFYAAGETVHIAAPAGVTVSKKSRR